jgi:hypothetical protein
MTTVGTTVDFGRASLAELEAVIQRNLDVGRKAFMDIGQSICAVQERRLYRERYGTFERYMHERWGWSRDYGYRIMRATRAVLSGDVDRGLQNERSVRAALSPPAVVERTRRPIVDPEYCRMLPSLSLDVFAKLEKSILSHGVLVPLLVSQDNVLLDGHARLSICEKHGIPYTTNVINLASREDAALVIISCQLSRDATPAELHVMEALLAESAARTEEVPTP